MFLGGFNTQTTSSASVFGQSSAFGTKPAFGTASTNNSVFGSTTTTTGAFGTNQGSPFAAKTTPSVFGQTTQASSSFSFSQAAANVPAFGGTPTTNTGTIKLLHIFMQFLFCSCLTLYSLQVHSALVV